MSDICKDIDNIASKRLAVKLDIEGAELDALKGFSSMYESIDLICCEVAIRKNFEGGPLASEVVCYLKEQGFEIFDQWGYARQPTNNFDLVFIPHDKI